MEGGTLKHPESTAAVFEEKGDSLRERVYRHLKEAISSGAIRYGQFLDQDAVCETLVVSKTPLRDALIRLEAEGFVTILPRKGVYINPITLSFIRSAYQIIGAVEADCLAEVFDSFTPYHILQLEASNTRRQECLQRGDYAACYAEDMRFHGLFLALSANELLARTLLPLHRRLCDFPRREHSSEWEALNLATHRRLVDSIRLGNRQAAVSILRTEHWSYDRHRKYFQLLLGDGEAGSEEKGKDKGMPPAAGGTAPPQTPA